MTNKASSASQRVKSSWASRAEGGPYLRGPDFGRVDRWGQAHRDRQREGWALTVSHHSSKRGLKIPHMYPSRAANTAVLDQKHYYYYSLHANTSLKCCLHTENSVKSVRRLNSHPRSYCPVPGGLFGAPRFEHAAPRSAADST